MIFKRGSLYTIILASFTKRVYNPQCRAFETGLVEPVITPRFVPSCSLELLRGLGKLAQEHKVAIQSHISESLDEVAFCKALHPEVSHDVPSPLNLL